MSIKKERMVFLKWRKENYPLLNSRDYESIFLWQGWQGCASIKNELSIQQVRQAVADYMHSEGCSCCQDVNKHKEHKAQLARLLHVPKYADGSGYDFSKFVSKAHG